VAVKSDGTVWAWGRNQWGELGDGTTTSRSTPVQVAGLTAVVAVAAGQSHTLALRSDGTVWAWGGNGGGQLGDGTTLDRHTPVQVLWDITPPTGTVSIDRGATYGGSTVALTLSASDDSGAIGQMRVSNDGVLDRRVNKTEKRGE
jgi:alpha-tubulin suppressor-like RCC1 family protein